MPLYQWDPELETGNEVIDEQHRQLFALANELAEAIASCPMTDEGLCEEDRNLVANAIYGLTDYCIEHFADEQELMASYEYPRLPTHISLHEQLTGETLKRAAQYFNDDDIVPETLAPFFAEWLTNHIRREDLNFAEYRRGRGAAR
jgi:hemerythrin